MLMRTFLTAFAFSIVISIFGCNGDGPSTATGVGGTAGQGGNDQGGQGGQGGSTASSLVLDEAYGDKGIARIRRSWSTDWIHAAEWMPDGTILCGGSTGGTNDVYRDMLLARLTGAGQIDVTYGSAGFVTLPLGDRSMIMVIEPLSDGSALVGGIRYRFISPYMFVARVDAKGALDIAFGTDGITNVALEPSAGYVKMAHSEAGHIALLGLAKGGALWLWRLDASGQVDTAFGNAGHVALSGDLPREVFYEPDGSILALVGNSSGGALYRIGPSGSIDVTFGTSGKVDVPFDPYALDRDKNGALLIAGKQLLKLDNAGKPDATFGTNGMVNPLAKGSLTVAKWLPNGDILAADSNVIAFPSTFVLGIKRFAADGGAISWNDGPGSPINQTIANTSHVAAILQKDAKIYLAGSRHSSTTHDDREVMTFALNDDGMVDTTFGNMGLAQYGSLAAPEVLRDMVLRADGSVIAMGETGLLASFARFSGGKHDESFGLDGFAPVVSGVGYGVAVDTSDRLLVASIGDTVARYTPTGALDMSFGMQGTANSTQGSGLVSNVAIDAQQRVVTTGKVVNQGLYVSRLLDNGNLDPGFGVGGVVIGPGGVSGSYSKGEAVLIEKDNKMVIAGMTDNIAPFVTRILEDGTTDAAFGSKGKTVITALIEAIRLIKRSNGGYIMAGSAMECIVESLCDIVVVALDANGMPDLGFGEGGITRIKGASNYSAWHGLAELPDGSIIVAGAIDDDPAERLAVWQLRPDGSINGQPFVLPGKGRATSAIVDGDGVLVGGWLHHATSGTDMVTLRLTL